MTGISYVLTYTEGCDYREVLRLQVREKGMNVEHCILWDEVGSIEKIGDEIIVIGCQMYETGGEEVKLVSYVFISSTRGYTMSLDFDFWDCEEDDSKENNLKTAESEGEVSHMGSRFKDLMYRSWKKSGTFVVRSEIDRLIITIGSDDGIYAIIKIPTDLIEILSTTMDELLDNNVKMEINDDTQSIGEERYLIKYE